MLEFATGVINVLEKRLFSPEDQERMLKSPNAASAFLALFDTDLAEVASKEEKNIEEILEAGVRQLKISLAQLLKEERMDLVWFLFLRFDALNLKLALKRIAGLRENGQEINFGFEKLTSIEQAIKSYLTNCQSVDQDGKFAWPFNPIFNQVVNLAVNEFYQLRQDRQEIASKVIEEIVDRAYFTIKLAQSPSFSKLLKEQVMLEIDIANLKALLSDNGACQTLSGKKVNRCFIKGGNLDFNEIKELAQGKEEEAIESVKEFLEVLDLGFLIDNYRKQKSPILLEKDFNSFLSKKVFEKERQTGAGIEKTLAYFQRKLNGLSNIRLIMFSKENNLLATEIEPFLLPIR